MSTIKDKKDLSGLPEDDRYCCPVCGAESPDKKYVIGGIECPQYHNYTSHNTPDDEEAHWDEVHKCPKCGTVYRMHNSD